MVALIKVKAFGLNHSELILRRYEADAPYIHPPIIPGIECVGEVEDPSDGTFIKGDKVAALMGGMGRSFHVSYAECVRVPAALGLKNGDVKIIKNAGGIISHPFGSVMRSLLIGIYELNVKEILVIGHTDYGAMYIDSQKMIKKMNAHGITQQNIDMIKYFGIDFDSWLSGFRELDTSVKKSVELIRKHPLVPEEIMVYGLIIDSVTGELKKIN